jgi:hypothetical protein
MKKLFTLLVLIGSAYLLVSCIDLTQVNSIELEWTPKERFVLDEELNLSEIEIRVHYLDGTSDIVGIETPGVQVVSGYFTSGGSYFLDTRTVGAFTLKVTYEGFSAQFDYLVNDPTVWDGVSMDEPDIIDNTYQIYTANELYWITQQGWEGIMNENIQILSDIDMGGHPFISTTSLGSSTLDGYKDETSNYTITGLAGTMFDFIIGDFTVSNLDVEVDVFKTGSYWTFGVYTYGPGTKVLFKNANVSGNIFSGNAVGGYIGYNNLWGDNYTIEFENCENELQIVALGQNNSAFVGYSRSSNSVVFDESTLTHARNNAKLQVVQTPSGLFGGNVLDTTWNNSVTWQIIDEFNNSEVTLFPFEPASVSGEMQLQDYFEFEKVSGGEKAMVTFEYTLMQGGFPRRNTQMINIDSYNVGDLIVTPVQMLYVTKDTDYIDNPSYIVNEEDITTEDHPDWGIEIKNTITVEFVQIDADGNILKVEKYTHNNYNA